MVALARVARWSHPTNTPTSYKSRADHYSAKLTDFTRQETTHSFNRVGNAPRFRISNLKYEISNRTIAARWARG